MNVYILTPNSVLPNPHLFPQFVKTWAERGWHFVRSIEDAEIVLWDLHSRISGYDQRDIDWIVDKRVGLVGFDEWDRGGMSTEDFPFPLTSQQNEVFACLHKIKSIFFCRLMDKTKSYAPYKIFPYEKPIMHEEPMYSKEELFNREYDITFIANSAPQRERIAKAFMDDGRLKCNISLGAQKIPLQKWVDEHRKAKFFMSCSGGGFTDERAQHLFSISAHLREATNQVRLEPYSDGINCIEVPDPPTKEQLDIIADVCSDKERLFSIYEAGYRFMKTYYSHKHIATNIAETVEKHFR